MSDLKSRMGMRNNARKFRGPGPRPDRNEQKRAEALARNAAWQALSPDEQWKALDQRFGKDKGATKQRIRLSMKLSGATRSAPAQDVVDVGSEPKKEKKSRAKDRRSAGK